MFSILRKHLGLLVVWGIIFAVAAGGLSFLFPLQYSAASQVLIISRDRSGVDPYTQAKAAERISGDLVEVVKTSDFFDKVMSSSSVIFNKSPWMNLSDRALRKKWQRDIKPETVYGTSLMRITAYSEIANESKNLSNAVAQTLVNKGWEYIGGDVVLKQVDSPLVSSFPTRPNVFLNIFAGFCVGVILSALWVLRYHRHLIWSR